MKKLLLLLAVALVFYGCTSNRVASTFSQNLSQDVSSSSAFVSENIDYYTHDNKTFYNDTFIPGDVPAFFWLDNETLLLNERIQRGVNITTAFYKLNINTNIITAYENEYPEAFSFYSVYKQNDVYKAVDYGGNVVVFKNDNTWAMEQEGVKKTNLSAITDLETQTIYEYNYDTEYLTSRQGDQVENLLHVPLEDKRYEYIAAIKISQDKKKLAFAVMKEMDSLKIISFNLITKEDLIYPLQLPVPGILWLDNELLFINMTNKDNAGTLAQLAQSGSIVDQVKTSKQDGDENMFYSNNYQYSGIINGVFPFINSDLSESYLYLLNIQNNKINVKFIEKMKHWAFEPALSPNGEYIAYYLSFIDEQKKQLVVQKIL